MTFKASLRELSNGFLVDLNPKPLEYEEAYAPTFEGAIALIVASLKKWHPSGPPKEPSIGALKYTKLCGIITKPFEEFEKQFKKSFPEENMELAIAAANCKVVDGQVLFRLEGTEV